MPVPWKKARLGAISRLLVSSLRSKAKRGVGDSPLVLQAGFPTSVADFVVKNRSRLRKPPRWRRPPRPGAVDAGCSTMATLASEIIAASAAATKNDSDLFPIPPGSPPPPPPPEVDEPGHRFPEPLHGLVGSKLEGFEGRCGWEAEKDGFLEASAPSKARKTEHQGSSPTAASRRAEACAASSTLGEAERKVLAGWGNEGFMVVAKVAVLVVILAIVSKKIAVTISIIAFAILFAESIGRRLLPWLGPCEESKKSLGVISGGVVPVSDLIQTPGESNARSNGGIPIPILLAGTGEPDLGSFHIERDWIVEAPSNATAASTVGVNSRALEENDHVKIEGGRGGREASNANRKKKKEEKDKKKKKLFGNFVLFGGSKGVKGGKMEGKLEPASDSGGGEGPGRRGTGEEALEEEEEDDDDDGGGGDRGVKDENKNGGGGGGGGLGLQMPAIAHAVGLEDAASVGALAKGSSGHLVFFVIVLSGLVGGRVVALILTVLWYSLVSSARSLWRSWNSHRSLEGVPDASISEAFSIGGGE